MKILLFLLLFVTPVYAQVPVNTPIPATGPKSLKVSWVDTDTLATGYKLYWGTGNGVFENTADIGFQAQHTNASPYTHVFNLPGVLKLCFAITAYNFTAESSKSPEFCQSVPAARVLLKVFFVEGTPIVTLKNLKAVKINKN